MSVSLWRWSEECEGKPCCGDCDECGEEEKMIPIKIERREPVMKWIPVSERLPEPNGHRRYIVTLAHYDPEYKGRHVDVAEYEARFDCAALGDFARSPYWEHGWGDGIRVTAWMPLPEPYREGDDD